ncbi:MAG TPA: hypothetical protein VG271_14855, partial [Beijerinckiaceae bacterium]|nr:hypothetical protein [Beijerinckiaceae bacterium]
MTMPRKITALASALLACCWALPAAAQDAVAQFYRGKTITIVVGSTAGGGYDAYARLMAHFFSKHTPGSPVIVVQNMPGAGENLMAAYVANVAAKDGTVIGAGSADTILAPLIGRNLARNYDPSKLKYIGSADGAHFVCYARTDAAVKTFADLFTRELIVGASGAGGGSFDFPVLYNNVLGTKFKIVSGYPGSRQIGLAIESGELQGECGIDWSVVVSTHSEWVRDRKINVLIEDPGPNMAGVPSAVDFAKTQQQRQILELVYSRAIFAWPYMVAAEVPNERVEALRKAFMETWTDPDLLAEAKKINLDVGPIRGADAQAMITKIYATSQDIIAKAKDALVSKP